MFRDKKLFKFVLSAAAVAVVALLYFGSFGAWSERESQTFIYSNISFGISLEYPASWGPNLEYGTFNSVPLYFSGSDGYFGIDAVGAGDNVLIDDAVSVLATQNPKNPYGTKPSISSTTIDGQDARLIFPSSDQPAEANNEAALVIHYPKSVKIGDNEFLFFMLYGNASHIERIGETLKFVGFEE